MLVVDVSGSVVVFIHVPKSGGTFVRSYLERLYPVIEKSWGIDSSTGADLAHLTSQQCQVEGRYVALVRNPYDRLISAFFHYYGRGSEGFAHYVRSRLLKETRVHFLPQHTFIDESVDVYRVEDTGSLPLGLDRVVRPRRYQPACKFYTEDMLLIVHTYYRQDFARFGYPKLERACDCTPSCPYADPPSYSTDRAWWVRGSLCSPWLRNRTS